MPSRPCCVPRTGDDCHSRAVAARPPRGPWQGGIQLQDAPDRLAGSYQSAMALMRLRIFLSSPDDSPWSGQRPRDLIERLNKDHLLKGRVEVEAVSWHDPDAPTSMPVNLRPQEAVNRGLARPSECDLVVVLLWNRMGAPLGVSEGVKANGEPYRSGRASGRSPSLSARSGRSIREHAPYAATSRASVAVRGATGATRRSSGRPVGVARSDRQRRRARLCWHA